MIYYTLKYNCDIIPNSHVKVVGDKTSTIKLSLARHSNSSEFNKKKNIYLKLNMNLDKKPIPLDQ
jgi:hypothetical protein